MAALLVIDDDPDARAILETFLRSRGHDVRGAGSGQEGLEALGVRIPELVILDVMMPGLSGWEVARSIRRHPEAADVPILMLTARDGLDDRREGLEAGADAYLVKPVRLADVEAKVRELLTQGDAYA